MTPDLKKFIDESRAVCGSSRKPWQHSIQVQSLLRTALAHLETLAAENERLENRVKVLEASVTVAGAVTVIGKMKPLNQPKPIRIGENESLIPKEPRP